jgi:dsRNA-specific ribonuclease
LAELSKGRAGFTVSRPTLATDCTMPMMNEEDKKLEACGDGLLLACARLYLRDRHRGIPYALYTRLITQMVCNRTLARISQAEGVHRGQDGAADALEREIARRYYREGFRDMKHWLWALFDRHLDVAEAARQMLDPDERERLQKIVRGAIRATMKQERQSVTERSIERAARQIVSHLKTGGEL